MQFVAVVARVVELRGMPLQRTVHLFSSDDKLVDQGLFVLIYFERKYSFLPANVVVSDMFIFFKIRL